MIITILEQVDDYYLLKGAQRNRYAVIYFDRRRDQWSSVARNPDGGRNFHHASPNKARAMAHTAVWQSKSETMVLWREALEQNAEEIVRQ